MDDNKVIVQVDKTVIKNHRPWKLKGLIFRNEKY